MVASPDSCILTDNVGRRLVPGQLWQWAFTVHDGSWVFQKVTEEGRSGFAAGSHLLMKRGDLFVIMVLDDPGPYQLPNINALEDGLEWVTPECKRWHVVLHRDILIWMEHDHLDTAILLSDVE